MSHPLPHRQLVKEFMSLGPYLRQEQSEPGRYFFDCLASCLNLNAEPELREFWGWWLVLEPCDGGFNCQSEIGLYNKEGVWVPQQPHVDGLDAVAGSRQHFLLNLQNKLKAWQLSLIADEQSLLDSSSVA